MEDINEIVFYIGGIVFILLLLIISAIISGSEVAIFSLSAKQLELCRESNDPKKLRILKLLESGTNFLATIIIVGNLVNIGFVIFSNYLLWKFFGKENITNVFMLAFTIGSAGLIVIFGELLPKMYANNHNLLIAKNMSGMLNILLIILRPISIPLIKIGGIFGKSFSPEKYNLSSEQLNRALELTISDNPEEHKILSSIASFGTLNAKQIMTPRTDITSIEIKSDFFSLMNLIDKSGYSRLPVYEETIDNIKGTVYIKDLISFIDENEDFKWQKLIRESFFIPETKKLDSLLLDFKEKRIHIAIVVDEYGGTSGLVTLEDIIQKIIGSSKKSDDLEHNNLAIHKKINNNVHIFQAKIYLNDFCSSIGVETTFFDEVKGESESLAGLILEINGKFPHVGEIINFKLFKFTILSIDSKRIKKVKVEISDKA